MTPKPDGPDGQDGRQRSGRRFLPVLLIAAGALAAVFVFGDQLDFETLRANQVALRDFRDAHYLSAVAIFLLAYVGIVALSLPGGTIATLTGGFLFGLFPGALFNLLGATLGACLLFLAVRAGFGARLSARIDASDGRAARLAAAIRARPWSALLTMRLIPAVPFFVANLLPALLNVRLPVFAATTFLGIIPGGVIYTAVGAGLGDVFEAGAQPDLGVIFRPELLLPLLGLAALSALPLLQQIRQAHRQAHRRTDRLEDRE